MSDSNPQTVTIINGHFCTMFYVEDLLFFFYPNQKTVWKVDKAKITSVCPSVNSDSEALECVLEALQGSSNKTPKKRSRKAPSAI